jgi:hypothetical protein
MAGSRSEFHRRLEAIEAKVIELFGMVVEDLPRATQLGASVGARKMRHSGEPAGPGPGFAHALKRDASSEPPVASPGL